MAHPLSGANIGTLATIMGRAGLPGKPLAGLGIGLSVLGRWPFSTAERLIMESRLPSREDLAPGPRNDEGGGLGRLRISHRARAVARPWLAFLSILLVPSWMVLAADRPVVVIPRVVAPPSLDGGVEQPRKEEVDVQ